MTRPERSAQIWPLLIMAARTQQVLSYRMIEQLTGIPRQGVGEFLGPIQEYCKRRGLPPLTSLVIKEDTGLPGAGFTAASDAFAGQARVFVYEWLSERTPSIQDFEDAASAAA